MKLARCPHSLAALLAAFTFYVAHPIRSSMAGEYIDSLEERPVFPGEKPLRAMDALIEPLQVNRGDLIKFQSPIH